MVLVNFSKGALTYKKLKSPLFLLVFVISISACSVSQNEFIEVNEGYLSALQGANSIARGAAEEPTRVSISPSAQPASGSGSTVNNTNTNTDSLIWEGLVELGGENPSGEDQNTNSISGGYGTIQNTVLLVDIARNSGWKIPDWVNDGVTAVSKKSGDGTSAYLGFLCAFTEAKCPEKSIKNIPSLEAIPTLVLEKKISDSEGHYAALAQISDKLLRISEKDIKQGLCKGKEKQLYTKAPQTFSILASLDKTCWTSIDLSAQELSNRIVFSISKGYFEDASALMLLTENVYGLLTIKEEVAPKVLRAWNSFIMEAEKEYGKNYLQKIRPLNIVLLSAQLKEWA